MWKMLLFSKFLDSRFEIFKISINWRAIIYIFWLIDYSDYNAESFRMEEIPTLRRWIIQDFLLNITSFS